MTKKDIEITEEAKRNFKLAVDAENKQRIREREDLKFQVPELQWDEQSRQQRGPGLVAGTAIPPRPTLSISKLNQPIQIINSQMRNSQLGVSVHPLSENADKLTAQVKQGLYRTIERDSAAVEIVRPFAFDRAVKAGRGVYRVNKIYDDYASNPFDQKIVIERILYQENVYLDPSAQMPDWSDGHFAFHVSWLNVNEFKRKYPKADASALVDDNQWASAFTDSPDWIKGDGDKRSVLVAEYFRKRYEGQMAHLLADGQVAYGDPPDGVEVIRSREVKQCKIDWYLLNGMQILDSNPWDGKYIPLIPVIGTELQPFDKERIWQGIIHNARDAQRLYNFAASGAVEIASLEPRAPWIMDPRQVEGYEEWWKQSNMRNFPYLPYKATMEGGSQIPPPQRVQIDASRLGPNMMLLEKADEFIMGSTGFAEAARGELLPKDRSGRAIEKLQSASAQGSSQYMDNMAKVSLPYEAKVVLDLMPSTYERPGRIAEILEGPQETQGRRVMLNIPYTQQGGVPQIANPADPGAQTHSMVDGNYGVTVEVKRAYQSRLDAAKEEIAELLGSTKEPGTMMILLSQFFKFQDEPWAQTVAKMMAKNLSHQMPWLTAASPDEQMTPEQMGQQLMQAQQENQALKEGIAKLTQELNTDKAKQMADIQTTQMEGQTKIQIAQLEARIDMKIAEMEAQKDILIAKLKAQMDAAKQSAQMQHDESMNERELRHDDNLAMMDRTHQAIEGEKSRVHEIAGKFHEASESDKERQHEGATQMMAQEHQSEESDKTHANAEKLAKMKPKPSTK